MRTIVMTLGLALVGVSGARAQTINLSWYTMDGGGAIATTGGAFTLSGTVGQPDAGVMAGGAFSVVGGFWGFGTGVAAATLTSAASRKSHGIQGVQDLAVQVFGHVEDGNVTSEPRAGGLAEVRLTFDVVPGGPGATPVTILEQSCAGCSPACSPAGTQGGYVPYSGAAVMSSAVEGNDLVLRFAPELEGARTYKLELNESVTSVAGQSLEVRVLLGDANSDGRTNASDRSQIVSVWTGAGFSPATDVNLDGRTNGGDRSVIVAVWTSAGGNCAP